jgi:hypothetical protein
MKKRTSKSMIAAISILVTITMICSTFAVVSIAQMAPQYGTYDSGQGYYGQQMPPTGGNAATAPGSSDEFQSIQGMEGFQGFLPGENVLSIAVIPVSQKNSQMGFQVIGFAISSPEGGTATVYSLSKPLPGVIDPSQNTLQIDLSGIAGAIDKAGYVDSSIVYDTIRTDPKVVVIEVDMDPQGKQGSQTIFNVNGVDIVPPDGRMQAFDMQQPTQLIIDSQTMRLYMVAFPQMVDAFGSFYGASYTQVQPVVYSQPVPVLAPVFVPYLRPYPIFFSSYVPYRPFVYGRGFTTFYDRTNIRNPVRTYPIHNRDFGRQEYNTFRKTTINRPITGGAGSATIRRPGAIGGGYSHVRTGGGIGGGRMGGRR